MSGRRKVLLIAPRIHGIRGGVNRTLARRADAAFQAWAGEGARIHCGSTGGRPWREIDFAADYHAAQRLFE